MKTCMFCKCELSNENRSREHILPQWLQKEWSLSDQVINPTHLSEAGEILSQRTHEMKSLLSGGVCRLCNSGWMSVLEEKCRPLILKLASGSERIAYIDDTAALLLARWTIKTAVCLHLASNWRRVIPDEHLFCLDKDDYRLPTDMYVVGHTYMSGREFSWIQTTTWPYIFQGTEVSEAEIADIKARGYKIALQLGGLYVMIFRKPTESGRLLLRWKKHFPLYPRWSHPVTWDKTEGAWPTNPGRRLNTFALSLGVCIADRTDPGPIC